MFEQEEAINVLTPFGKYRIRAIYGVDKERPSQKPALLAALGTIEGTEVVPLSSSVHVDVDAEDQIRVESVISGIRKAYSKAGYRTEEPRKVDS